MASSLGGSVGYPGVPTINAKKHRRWAPCEAVPEIWERPPSTLRNVDGGPLRGGARNLGALTINAKKHRQRPPGRRCWISGSVHHQHQKTSTTDHLGGCDGDSRAPTINAKKW
jgi:hypothetical protein